MKMRGGMNVNGVRSTNVPPNVVKNLPMVASTGNKKAKIETKKKVEGEDLRKEMMHQGAKDGVVMGLKWKKHMPWFRGD
ncbi:hypothetical protein RJT34_24159 [Clitoria ternatea]|uniref:Uncharacterized protein n=1 Tax=Clitoria ternatea TaxID=43366 RepID=A0AAN9IJ06_CLITE